ncbi:hypothetical protein Sinac_1481 [Singulisphaera acidiphila DSM 18658]|uniref:Uncharacterized protein n=1 Tax=Singulisphaera acidiphila (strain ATCC BAA-1392 / DSM 18658 / VKM B-2454 / MOB10) TaxID=886293 RepID=L0DB39_SINAD|nr:hypothetical protein Sinac_1481 [Singulisphaera acidiphila DSM 18658]
MFCPKLAGQAMVMIVGEIRRPVPCDMGPGIGAAGLVLGSPPLVPTTVVVRTLDHHCGQDVEQN